MHLDGAPNGCVGGSAGTDTTASHLAVVLLRESYLGDRPLCLTLWVRAGVLSKRMGVGVGGSLCHHHTVLIDSHASICEVSGSLSVPVA